MLPSFLDTFNEILKQHEMQPKSLFKDDFFFQPVSIRKEGCPNISPVWSQFSLLPKPFGSRTAYPQEEGVCMIQSSKLHYWLHSSYSLNKNVKVSFFKLRKKSEQGMKK